MTALLGCVWVLVLLGPELQQGRRWKDVKLPVRCLSTSFTLKPCFGINPAFITCVATQVTENNTYFCRFPNSVLHRGAVLRVHATSHGETFQETLIFNNSGREGSGATNFSCLIYNIRFMNCSWSTGPAAPADVQYYLYKWDTWDGEEVECSQYLSDPMGLHVGCHFDKLSEPSRLDNYFFFLNGTSKETAIQFLDFIPFVATAIEKYNPPTNITISYNGSNHIIQWEHPKTRFGLGNSVLCYELDLQRKGSSRDPVFQKGADANVYLVPRSDAAAENTLRIRVRYRHNSLWSEWSETQRFGFQKQGFDATVVVIALVVGATAVVSVALIFFFKRYSVRQKLFPPIPQVKGELAGVFIQNAEMPCAGDSPAPATQESEEILTVEEMG